MTRRIIFNWPALEENSLCSSVSFLASGSASGSASSSSRAEQQGQVEGQLGERSGVEGGESPGLDWWCDDEEASV